LTEQQDPYLGVVATAVFLAGCAIEIANRYRRTRERQRWEPATHLLRPFPRHIFGRSRPESERCRWTM